MAFLDKLKFWKKKEPAFPPLGQPGDELGLSGFGKDDLGLPSAQKPLGLDSPRTPDPQPTPQLSGFGSPQRPSFGEATPPGRDRDMEIALAKLDTIKALLDSLDHRVAMIEQQGREKKPQRSRYEYV